MSLLQEKITPKVLQQLELSLILPLPFLVQLQTVLVSQPPLVLLMYSIFAFFLPHQLLVSSSSLDQRTSIHVRQSQMVLGGVLRLV